jgi:hypothetical protein
LRRARGAPSSTSPEPQRAAAEQAKQPEVNEGDEGRHRRPGRQQNQIDVTIAKIIAVISSHHPSSEKN